MTTSRRAFLRGFTAVGGAAGMAILTAACRPGNESSSGAGPAPDGVEQGAARPDRTFKIAYLTAGMAGIEITRQLGLLEERGWKIDWQNVDLLSGTVNAFGSGRVDLIDISTVLGAQMYEQGVKLTAFG